MSNKKIVLILILLVFLPALFYTVYEISIYNEDENALTQIYDQKLGSILFSINQYYWDSSHKIKSDFSQELARKGTSLPNILDTYLQKTEGLNAVLITDSLMADFRILIKPDSNFIFSPSELRDSVRTNENIIKRLFHRQKIGYSRIEPVLLHFKNGEKFIVLLFIIEHGDLQGFVGGLIFNAESFANSKLTEKLPDFSEQEVVLGIFHKDEAEPAISTGDISLKNARIIKKLWLIPEYLIAIKTQEGKTISEQLDNRFKRSLLLIFLLDVILLVSALILYRAVRREVELAAMKTDFVSNISHELRTPLSLIRMFSESLEMGRVTGDENKMKYYKIITQETQRLTHLINNILDFSKMEAGKKQLQFKKEDLNLIVQKCTDSYRFHLDSEGFTLEIKYASIPVIISADKETITEAIINLLDNSVKYSEQTKNISISTGTENESAFVEIADKGIGISDLDQKYVFDKFYRVSDGLTHNVKGSGLGLTLVKHAVLAHQGDITVQSQKGKGSRFRISFPLIRKQEIL